MSTRLNRAKKGIKQTREAEECYEDSAKVKIGDEVIMRDVNIAKEAHIKAVRAEENEKTVLDELETPERIEDHNKNLEKLNKIIEETEKYM